MNRFLGFLKRVTKGSNISKAAEVEKVVTQTPSMYYICTNHNQDLYPGVLALEYCETSNQHLCYMCSSKHILVGNRVRCKLEFLETDKDCCSYFLGG
jgi:hypothetical protein